MRNRLGIIVGKLLIIVGKLMGKKSSSTPGQLALKVSPNLVKYFADNVEQGTVIVCGTNGKTTTNNMIADAMEASGATVVCNRIGANMLGGVATAFIENASIFGRNTFDYAVLEVDEASLRHVTKYIDPDYLVITNLFRDQLDRYGELDTTVDFLKQGIDKCKKTRLVLNADDPVVSQFNQLVDCPVINFGVEKTDIPEIDDVKEGRFCPMCGSELSYKFYHYAQLGDYYCEQCSFARPSRDFEAKNVSLTSGLAFTIESSDSVEIDVQYRGFYNIYNILASFVAAKLLGAKTENIKQIYEAYKPQIGRMETFDVKIPLTLNLAKNPAGFNQGIRTVLEDSRSKAIIIAINDNDQDGKDISWLWDVDFERLDSSNLHRVIITGKRRDDMAVRLKYTDMDQSKISIIEDYEEACLMLSKQEVDCGYVLVNYTVLFEMQSILKKLEAKGV